jgi:hypothetical protein
MENVDDLLAAAANSPESEVGLYRVKPKSIWWARFEVFAA